MLTTAAGTLVRDLTESKKFNPTVLMKNKVMKNHFKKQRRQTAYENLVVDNRGEEENEEFKLDNKGKVAVQKGPLKPMSQGHSTAVGVNPYSLKRERKMVNYRTPPSEKAKAKF